MNAVRKQLDEELVKGGPYIRGSVEWIDREAARARLGAVCINVHEIPAQQAFGEKKAELQQAEIPEATREQVRRELRMRGVLPHEK